MPCFGANRSPNGQKPTPNSKRKEGARPAMEPGVRPPFYSNQAGNSGCLLRQPPTICHSQCPRGKPASQGAGVGSRRERAALVSESDWTRQRRRERLCHRQRQSARCTSDGVKPGGSGRRPAARTQPRFGSSQAASGVGPRRALSSRRRRGTCPRSVRYVYAAIWSVFTRRFVKRGIMDSVGLGAFGTR